MTTQIPDSIYENGERYALHGSPLGAYLAKTGISSKFSATCTALWRGYRASWELVDDRLYLTDIRNVSLDFDGDEANKMGIGDVFPGFTDRVFAHWYCGTLRIPDGEKIESFYAGWGGTWERYRLIHIHRGIVTARSIKHNKPRLNKRVPQKPGVWQRLCNAFKAEGEA
jgi:hypothetical protein